MADQCVGNPLYLNAFFNKIQDSCEGELRDSGREIHYQQAKLSEPFHNVPAGDYNVVLSFDANVLIFSQLLADGSAGRYTYTIDFSTTITSFQRE